jgi:hypothetical protein
LVKSAQLAQAAFFMTRPLSLVVMDIMSALRDFLYGETHLFIHLLLLLLLLSSIIIIIIIVVVVVVVVVIT